MNKSCSKVLNFLERLDDRFRCTHEETVAVVIYQNNKLSTVSFTMKNIKAFNFSHNNNYSLFFHKKKKRKKKCVCVSSDVSYIY